MGRHHTLSWWRDAVTTWLASRQSAAEYAESLRVSASTLRYYRRQFAVGLAKDRSQEPIRLVHVEVAPAAVAPAPAAYPGTELPMRLLVRVGPAELEVAVGTDPAWTATLIAAIGKASARC